MLKCVAREREQESDLKVRGKARERVVMRVPSCSCSSAAIPLKRSFALAQRVQICQTGD